MALVSWPSVRNRPRSTVENTSRFSSAPGDQRSVRTFASSSGSRMRRSGRRRRAHIGDPAVEIAQRARAQHLLSRDGFFRAAQALAVGALGRRSGERREQAEIDVHRLERARAGVDGLDMPAGDVAEQRAERRGRRRAAQRSSGRSAAANRPASSPTLADST